MVKVNNISKSFKDVQALDDVTFSAEKGELYGIIGPDGAGKTTLFRIMTTLTIPDKGTVFINNKSIIKDYMEIRKTIGYMPGKFALYQDLTVEENLNFFASVFNADVNDNYDLIKGIYSHIAPFKKRKAGEVLFLDEPTTGVDPVSRKEFWDMLAGLKEMGITIIVSTPYMDEASRCDRIALIKNGKFLRVDTPNNIIEKFNSNLIAVKTYNMRHILDDLRKCTNIKSAFAFGSEIHALIDDYSNIENVSLFLNNLKYNDIEIHKIKPNIEDCFIWSR